ncbi:hypothetical protein ACLB2K_021985 [Fragaria x ananassa]
MENRNTIFKFNTNERLYLPKRGQVKIKILKGLFKSLASMLGGHIQDHDNYVNAYGGVSGTFIPLGTSGQGINYHYRNTKIYEANKLINDVTLRLSLSLSSDSNSDADLASVPRLMIDEILNDTDSSTSPSPSSSSRSSSALSQFLASNPKLPQSDDVSVVTTRSSQLEEKSVQSGLNLYSRARSGDFPNDQVRIATPARLGI